MTVTTGHVMTRTSPYGFRGTNPDGINDYHICSVLTILSKKKILHCHKIEPSATCLWVVVEFVFVGSDVVGAYCCLCWCGGGVSGGAHVVAGGRL